MSRMAHNLVIRVADSSQVGEARRAAVRLAQLAEFGEVAQGEVAIVATELATNLLRHAGEGSLLLRTLSDGRSSDVELLALDSGPGMADPDRCLQDGYSTGGTQGNGLGAVRRLSAEFDLFSSLGLGTAVLARIAANSRDARAPSWAWGAVSVACRGEQVCGDDWSVSLEPDRFGLLVADGLGHGPLAAEAATAAVGSFDAHAQDEPRRQLEHVHQALAGTRGAAVATARYDVSQRRLSYAGVGNISGTLLSATTSRGLFSHNGTLGVQARRIQQFEYPCEEPCLLILHSDGLQSRWNFDKYPGLTNRHPAIVAGLLYRDFDRGRDDVTVVVARLPAGANPR